MLRIYQLTIEHNELLVFEQFQGVAHPCCQNAKGLPCHAACLPNSIKL